jgi:hypothetical protein
MQTAKDFRALPNRPQNRTMAMNQLVLEGQTFQIAWRSLVARCKLFLESPNLLSTLRHVRARASEAHCRLFLAAVEEAMAEIVTKNAMDLESLSREFQFVGLGQQIGEFVSQHPHVEAVPIKSAISDLQNQPAGQNRELCQLAEADGRARAERDSRLEGLRGAIEEVAKKQQRERGKVSGPQEAVGKVRHQLDGVAIAASWSAGAGGDGESNVSIRIRCRRSAGSDGRRECEG